MYSWQSDRRANRAHIRYFIAQAIEQKQWAENIGPEWIKRASQMSLDMLSERRTLSVRALARKSMEYTRYRAFMRSAYASWPGDKPMHDLWMSLA